VLCEAGMSGRHVVSRVFTPWFTNSFLGLPLQTARNSCVLQTSRTFVSSTHLRSPATQTEESLTKRWQVFASVIVERPRILCQPETEFEEEYRLMVEDFEHAKALKSDHEMRIEQDIRNQERKRKGLEVVNEPLQTGFEYEELREKCLSEFQPSPHISESGDLQSLHRLMDEKLYLMVPHFLGPGKDWFLPSAAVEGKSSLREAVDEAISRTFGKDAHDQIQVMGNAPFGFYKYRYPGKSPESQQHRGGKFFLFKAFLKDPRTFAADSKEKLTWMSKPEMKQHLHPALNNKVQQCLFDY